MAERLQEPSKHMEEDRMSLVDEFKVPCVLMEQRRISDGEGGFITSWADSGEFMAAISRDMTMVARVAEQEGLRNVYTVTTSRNLGLKFHDVFRRVSDGQIFRVTSNADDKRTPDVATFEFEQVSAEEWQLT